MSKAIFLNDNLPAPRTQRGISRYFDNVKEAVAREFPGQVALCSASPADPQKLQILPLAPLQRQLSRKTPRPHRDPGGSPGKSSRLLQQLLRRCRDLRRRDFHHFRHDTRKNLAARHNSRINRKFVLERQSCFVRAAAILAISESTARDFKSIYSTLGHKVVTTPLGVDAFFFEQPVEQPAEPAPPEETLFPVCRHSYALQKLYHAPWRFRPIWPVGRFRFTGYLAGFRRNLTAKKPPSSRDGSWKIKCSYFALSITLNCGKITPGRRPLSILQNTRVSVCPSWKPSQAARWSRPPTFLQCRR